MKRLTRVARVDGVDINFHWSTFILGGLLVLSALPKLREALVAVGAYLSILLIHEWGHVVAARRRRCVAWSIEIYPILGLTRLSAPGSYFDECVIAWGGVLAQAVVAAPLIAWVTLFGYTESEQTNAVLGLLGYFSAFIAVLNLMPVPRLDGAKAWFLIPMLLSRGIGAWLRRSPRAAPRAAKRKWTH
jgi:Zn-dependent protease